jgi:hypothetical protein
LEENKMTTREQAEQAVREFVETYERDIKPGIENADYGKAVRAINGICSRYDELRLVRTHFPSNRVYAAYRIAVTSLAGLLSISGAEARKFLSDDTSRRVLLKTTDPNFDILGMVFGSRPVLSRT